MQIKRDTIIPFLNKPVTRNANGLLTTTVYRKPTQTDQYLAYNSHHPQLVKRGIVNCLHNHAKHLTAKPSAIAEEKKHLSSVLASNGYPSSFVRKLTKTTRTPILFLRHHTVCLLCNQLKSLIRRCRNPVIYCALNLLKPLG